MDKTLYDPIRRVFTRLASPRPLSEHLLKEYFDIAEKDGVPDHVKPWVASIVRQSESGNLTGRIAFVGSYLEELADLVDHLVSNGEGAGIGSTLVACFAVELGTDVKNIAPSLANDYNEYAEIDQRRAGFGDTDPILGANRAAQRANEATESLAGIQSNAATALTNFVNSGEAARHNIETMLENSRKTIEDAEKTANAARDQVQGLSGRIAQLQRTVDSTEAGVNAFTEAVDVRVGLRASHDLWQKRHFIHRRSFRFSMLVLIVLIVGPVLSVIFYADMIVGFVNHLDELLRHDSRSVVASSAVSTGISQSPSEVAASTAIAILNRLLVFGMPVAFYIWLIKYVIRYNQHALLLSEDAAQRYTMIDAYVKLIAQNAGPEDRAIIFAALFRPGVAQPTDSMELPFIEVAKALRG